MLLRGGLRVAALSGGLAATRPRWLVVRVRAVPAVHGPLPLARTLMGRTLASAPPQQPRAGLKHTAPLYEIALPALASDSALDKLRSECVLVKGVDGSHSLVGGRGALAEALRNLFRRSSESFADEFASLAKSARVLYFSTAKASEPSVLPDAVKQALNVTSATRIFDDLHSLGQVWDLELASPITPAELNALAESPRSRSFYALVPQSFARPPPSATPSQMPMERFADLWRARQSALPAEAPKAPHKPAAASTGAAQRPKPVAAPPPTAAAAAPAKPAERRTYALTSPRHFGALDLLLGDGWSKQDHRLVKGGLVASVPRGDVAARNQPVTMSVAGPADELAAADAVLRDAVANADKLLDFSSSLDAGAAAARIGSLAVRETFVQRLQARFVLGIRGGPQFVHPPPQPLRKRGVAVLGVKPSSSAAAAAGELRLLSSELEPHALRIVGPEADVVNAVAAELAQQLTTSVTLPVSASLAEALRPVHAQFVMDTAQPPVVLGQVLAGDDGRPVLLLAGMPADVDEARRALEPVLLNESPEAALAEIARTDKRVADLVGPPKAPGASTKKPVAKAAAAHRDQLPMRPQDAAALFGAETSRKQQLEKELGVRLELSGDARQLAFIGDLDAIAKARAAIDARTKAAPGAHVKVPVPASALGGVLGASAADLKALAAAHDVVAFADRRGNVQERFVNVLGEPQAVDRARAAIEERVAKVVAAAAAATSEAAAASGETPATKKAVASASKAASVTVDDSKLARVKARLGSWEREFGVTLLLDETTLRITGPAAAVDAARRAVAARMGGERASRDNVDVHLPIDAAAASRLLVFRGSVIRQLEDALGVRMRVARDDKGAAALHVTGSARAVEAAKAGIATKLAEAVAVPDAEAEGETVATVAMDDVLSGYLIGQRGATIRGMEAAHKVEMHVARPMDGAREARLMIKGPKEAVEKARAEVEERVRSAAAKRAEDELAAAAAATASQPQPSAGKASQGADKRALKHSAQVSVAGDMVGYVIGPAGSRIHAWAEELGVRLNFNRDRAVGDAAVLLVEGATKEAVHKAKEDIEQRLKSPELRPGPVAAQAAGGGNAHVAQVAVGEGMTGLIIGTGGTNIKKWMDEFDVKLYIDRQEAKGDETVLRIVGRNADSVAAAQSEIERRLADASTREPTRKAGAAGSPTAQALRGSHARLTMSVEPALVGGLIGPRGAEIKALQVKLGVGLFIRTDDAGPGTLDIVGPADAIEAARAHIETVVLVKLQERLDNRTAAGGGGGAGAKAGGRRAKKRQPRGQRGGAPFVRDRRDAKDRNPAVFSPAVRDEVLARHASDPLGWTAEALAAEYGLPRAKVEAFLALRAAGPPGMDDAGKRLERAVLDRVAVTTEARTAARDHAAGERRRGNDVAAGKKLDVKTVNAIRVELVTSVF